MTITITITITNYDYEHEPSTINHQPSTHFVSFDVMRRALLSTGPDILDRLRSMLGIDALSTVTDAEGSTAVTAGSYVGSGVFVGLTQGATNTSGGATVEVDITDNIKARGEAQANGNTRVGVAAEWEY